MRSKEAREPHGCRGTNGRSPRDASDVLSPTALGRDVTTATSGWSGDLRFTGIYTSQMRQDSRGSSGSSRLERIRSSVPPLAIGR